MRLKRNLLKKKAVTIGAVLLAIPFLFGFKAEDAEDLNNNSPKTQTSEGTVDESVKGEPDKKEEKVTGENKELDVPQKVEYDKRDSHNEEEYRKYIAQFEGRTIVKIDFEGAGSSTLPAVQSAALMHVGDTFSAAAAIRDVNAIRNTGYFYDAYQTFS